MNAKTLLVHAREVEAARLASMTEEEVAEEQKRVVAIELQKAADVREVRGAIEAAMQLAYDKGSSFIYIDIDLCLKHHALVGGEAMDLGFRMDGSDGVSWRFKAQ